MPPSGGTSESPSRIRPPSRGWRNNRPRRSFFFAPSSSSCLLLLLMACSSPAIAAAAAVAAAATATLPRFGGRGGCVGGFSVRGATSRRTAIRSAAFFSVRTASFGHARPTASFLRRTTTDPVVFSVVGLRRRRWNGDAETTTTTVFPSSSLSSFRRFLSSSSTASSTTSSSCEMTETERQMTEDALSITAAAIRAVDPRIAVLSRLSASSDGLEVTTDDDEARRVLRYRQEDYDEVLLISFGKASTAMALTAAEVVREAMPKARRHGIVVAKDGHVTEEELSKLPSEHSVTVLEASHPIPDSRSVEAASRILSLVRAAESRTLVLCCISGGGSALFCSPKPPLTTSDLMRTNEILLASGATIDETNDIRKRLESGKGGRLAASAYPATVLGLVLSDVVGDPLDSIASGPTVPDESRREDVERTIERLKLDEGGSHALPPAVLDVLRTDDDDRRNGEGRDDGGAAPDRSHPAFATTRRDGSKLCETVLVGNNDVALTAAAIEAERLGYETVILGSTFRGEAKEIAGIYVSMAQRLARQRQSDDPFAMARLPAALIAGGETTVTLPPSSSSGKGGRNQEIGLVAGLKLRESNLRDVVIASVGTDGTDGPTDAAGVVTDGGTIDRTERRWAEATEAKGGEEGMTGERALERHDSYTFFDGPPSSDEGDRETTGPGDGRSSQFRTPSKSSSSSSSSWRSPLVRTGPTGTNVADVCVVLVK